MFNNSLPDYDVIVVASDHYLTAHCTRTVLLITVPAEHSDTILKYWGLGHPPSGVWDTPLAVSGTAPLSGGAVP